MFGMTRGELNNNPCNIRISNTPWQGKITPSQDPAFEQFDTAIDGIRAGGKILVTYYKSDGLSTVQEIISRWAPPSDDNPTDAYITNVAKWMGVNTSDVLDVLDGNILGSMLSAIITQENGQNIYSAGDISQAVTEALA